jgi:hypothetical protein
MKRRLSILVAAAAMVTSFGSLSQASAAGDGVGISKTYQVAGCSVTASLTASPTPLNAGTVTGRTTVECNGIRQRLLARSSLCKSGVVGGLCHQLGWPESRSASGDSRVTAATRASAPSGVSRIGLYSFVIVTGAARGLLSSYPPACWRTGNDVVCSFEASLVVAS